MAKPAVTTKISPDALRLLRLIAAATGEQQYDILVRLLQIEAQRLNILRRP